MSDELRSKGTRITASSDWHSRHVKASRRPKPAPERRCIRCGAKLNSYNRYRACAPCIRANPDLIAVPTVRADEGERGFRRIEED